MPHRRTTFPGVSPMPTVGASVRKIKAWTRASELLPRTLPSVIAERRTGATSTDCKKPVCLSSMMEIVENIDVKSRMSASVPGKEYSR